MVFQDGAGARQYVVPVLDNLIAKGDIPVTVGVFIEPGGIKAPRDNRSFEYDTLSDQYARFLLEEILPEVEKTVQTAARCRGPRDCRPEQWRDCRIHRRVGTAR